MEVSRVKINMVLVKLSLLLLIVMAASPLNAQFIIEQKEYRLPVNYDLLPENTEFENPADEAKYFLTLPENKLKTGASEIKESKSTVYLDEENFAVDFESVEQGKVTSLFNVRKKVFYYILWADKQVYKMTDEDIKQIQKDAQAMRDKMMAGLSPEMRKQMEAQMKKDAQTKKINVTATGKKQNISGFECSQYFAESEEDLKVIWATDDLPGLSKSLRKNFERYMEQMQAIFPSEEGDSQDEWDLVDGKIPVEVRSMHSGMDMRGTPEIEVTLLTKIARQKPPAEKFIPPSAAEGFTYGSMKDMMSQMMNMMFEE